MQEDKKISRGQFLTIVSSAAGALVLGRLVGMLGSTTAASNIGILKSSDPNAYGSFPYGGVKA